MFIAEDNKFIVINLDYYGTEKNHVCYGREAVRSELAEIAQFHAIDVKSPTGINDLRGKVAIIKVGDTPDPEEFLG